MGGELEPSRMMLRIAADERRFLSMSLTERLTQGVQTALAAAGLPPVADCLWEVPRQAEHGDYASNVAMASAKAARKAPRQIAEAIVKHFPPMPEVARLEIAGPGFVNVFLAPAWVATALSAKSALSRTEFRPIFIIDFSVRSQHCLSDLPGQTFIADKTAIER